MMVILQLLLYRKRGYVQNLIHKTRKRSYLFRMKKHIPFLNQTFHKPFQSLNGYRQFQQINQ